MTEKRAAPKLLKSSHAGPAWWGSQKRGAGLQETARTSHGSPGPAEPPDTLTPSSGPRPITVSPGARATRGPPSCGCSSKPPDMAARTTPLLKETVPAAVSAFHGHARGLSRPSEKRRGRGSTGSARASPGLAQPRPQLCVRSPASPLRPVTRAGIPPTLCLKIIF